MNNLTYINNVFTINGTNINDTIIDISNNINQFSVINNPEYLKVELDSDDNILSYRDTNGILHEEMISIHQAYDEFGNEIELATVEDIPDITSIELANLDGVVDHSKENLFDSTGIRTFDSSFADAVYEKIGRKTGSTGCYSNNIPCEEGDWFTRSDFGTGIVVGLDSAGNILGDVANAAYQPTVCITPSDSTKYSFSNIKYVVFVVMLENLESEKIVRGKYITQDTADYMTIPKLKISSDNVTKDTTVYFKSESGKYYTLTVNESDAVLSLNINLIEGIPAAELPSDFPIYTVSGSFGDYYDGLVFCPIEGGITPYLYELASNGMVKRYLKKKVNCPRILKENGTWYYYGVDGTLNTSSGYLNIYKADDETFTSVYTNLGDSNGDAIEPHDCLVLSVYPLHYIVQQYTSVNATLPNGSTMKLTALHVEEIYEGVSVWTWHSEDYPELYNDSHVQSEGSDYLHNNTICLDSDGNLCLNNKQANQILVIKRTWDDNNHIGTIGEILWKIGGNSSHEGYDVSTRIKPTATQQWHESHDAIIDSNGLWHMYDNRASSASRILEFSIDTTDKVLSDFTAYTWNNYRGRYMGSVDKVSDGVYLVSWGSSRGTGTANAGIYDFINNEMIFEITFDVSGSSAYRVYGIKKE